MKKLTYLETGMLPVFPEELLLQITTLLNQKYIPFLDEEYFSFEAAVNVEQVQIKLTLFNSDKTMFYPIEAVCPIDEGEHSPEEYATLMLDYLTAYFNEYLSEGRDTYLPINWSTHSCEDITFYLRGFVRNKKLEEEADTLLENEGFGEYHINSISAET